jgi:hypothetical protein
MTSPLFRLDLHLFADYFILSTVAPTRSTQGDPGAKLESSGPFTVQLAAVAWSMVSERDLLSG